MTWKTSILRYHPGVPWANSWFVLVIFKTKTCLAVQTPRHRFRLAFFGACREGSEVEAVGFGQI